VPLGVAKEKVQSVSLDRCGNRAITDRHELESLRRVWTDQTL